MRNEKEEQEAKARKPGRKTEIRREKYHRGMAMADEGMSAREIATELGYVHVQSWHEVMRYFNEVEKAQEKEIKQELRKKEPTKKKWVKRNLTERCEPMSPDDVQPAAILAGLPERIRVVKGEVPEYIHSAEMALLYGRD